MFESCEVSRFWGPAQGDGSRVRSERWKEGVQGVRDRLETSAEGSRRGFDGRLDTKSEMGGPPVQGFRDRFLRCRPALAANLEVGIFLSLV
ncbi:MAG: hypothetical protein Q9188_000301 [Gyalolechia gomerana]